MPSKLTKLAVAIDIDREARPGAEFVARVHVSDARGRPAPAQVTLWAVDEAVVLLESFRTPDLHEAFGYERGDDVAMMDLRDLRFWEHDGMPTTRSPAVRPGPCRVPQGRPLPDLPARDGPQRLRPGHDEVFVVLDRSTESNP